MPAVAHSGTDKAQQRSEILRRACEKAGAPAYILARLHRLSGSTLCSWTRYGLLPTHPDTQQRLARALGIPLEQLRSLSDTLIGDEP